MTIRTNQPGPDRLGTFSRTKHWRWLLTLLLVGLVLAGAVSPAQAGPPSPRTPPRPSQPPWRSAPALEADGAPAAGATTLSGLKAVLLVGPIDGDNGAWTIREKQNMNLAAAELAANGVAVHKFYTPNNDWAAIKAAADGAHFLFYRGHGVYWSPMPSPTVGGFSLKNRFVSADDIRSDLNLAPNAIVMLYGCFTAGTANNDVGSITSQEARRRVAQYSDPFFDIGAAGYYANWYGNAFQMFVRYLFQGKTLGQAYESYFDYRSTSVERYTHPNHPGTAMWLDKDKWDGKTQYNNAFAGLPDRTLADLFQPAMVLAPGAIVHLAQPDFPARSYTGQVDSTMPQTFTWTASFSPPAPSWLTVHPLSGESGESLTLVVTPTGRPLGTYQGSIRVVADDPDIGQGDQTIPVTLKVVDQVHSVYVPVVGR